MFYLQLQYPQLLIKSRKAPAPEGFVTHGSKLDSLKNGPIFVHWVNGKIKNVYTVSGEDPAIVNLKIAVASLFQVKSYFGIMNFTKACLAKKVTFFPLENRDQFFSVNFHSYSFYDTIFAKVEKALPRIKEKKYKEDTYIAAVIASLSCLPFPCYVRRDIYLRNFCKLKLILETYSQII